VVQGQFAAVGWFGGQGVFIGVFYPLRQTNRPQQTGLAPPHRALAA